MITIQDALEILENCPIKSGIVYIPFEVKNAAVEVLRRVASGELAEVVHAHWIDYMADKKDWLRDDGKSVFIECSACHEKLCRNLMLSEKYCPNCGAIMLEDNSHEAD